MIEAIGLGARAGGFALRDISFSVPARAWGIVLGPAGAGKTTLLETIAGIRRPTSGRVMLRGVDVTNDPPEGRRIGMVYQHAYLFPHLSVAENIAYGATDPAVARDVASRLGVDVLHDRQVATLSGGERQVVALARALAPEPDILLLDEPFAALDPRRRTMVRAELRRMHRESGITILQVTHDFVEAGTIGDIAIVLDEGTVAQVDAPDSLFRKPVSPKVADFLGFENVFSGQVSSSGDGSGDRLLAFAGSGIDLIGVGDHPGGAGHAVIRAEDVTLAREAPGASSARNVLRGLVVSVSRHGPLSHVTIAIGLTSVTATLTDAAVREMGFEAGVPAVAIIKAPAVHLCKCWRCGRAREMAAVTSSGARERMLDFRRSSGSMQVIRVHSRPTWMLYAEALLTAGAAVVLSWALRDVLVGARLSVFWPTSVFIAWRCGLGPVAVASLVGSLLWNYVFHAVTGAPNTITPSEIFSIIVYVAVSTSLGFTVDHLRRARIRVAQATNGMNEAMFVFDAQWHLRFVNDAGNALLQRIGMKLADLKARDIWAGAPGAHGTIFESETRRAQRERVIVDFQAQVPKTDIWVHVRIVPAEDGGVAAFLRDVTATKRAELERTRTEERYRALVEASTVMVFSSDPSGRVSEMPEWRALTGQPTSELRTSGLIDAIHADDRERVADASRTAIATENPYTIEYRMHQRDGSYRWYRSRAVPIYENDAIREWVGVFDDIEDEHLARQRHAAVDNALGVLGTSLDYEWNLAAVTRLLVPTLADYCSIDLVDETGTIRRVSSTHSDPQKEEILRELWRKYPYQEGDRGVPSVVKNAAAEMSPSIDVNDVVAYAKTEEQRDMLLALAPRSFLSVPMISHGKVFGALALVYSDSGRSYGGAERAAVEQIAARAATAIENARLFSDAQAASRAKSEFLATMSHELRTPLNAIAGYADLMAMGVRGPVTPDQLRDLKRIRQNQKHLLEIITNILNFSRIEAGHIRYDIRPCALGEVLERMEGVIEPQARAREITYEYLPVDASVAVAADREKLEQVLINLLGNAVKFTSRGGHITLSAVQQGGRVRIDVRDTGVGIKADQLNSIFEPFVQLESAFTRTVEGTGLGLAISRELARGMGGELSAASTPGEGSVFTLALRSAE